MLLVRTLFLFRSGPLRVVRLCGVTFKKKMFSSSCSDTTTRWPNFELVSYMIYCHFLASSLFLDGPRSRGSPPLSPSSCFQFKPPSLLQKFAGLLSFLTLPQIILSDKEASLPVDRFGLSYLSYVTQPFNSETLVRTHFYKISLT